MDLGPKAEMREIRTSGLIRERTGAGRDAARKRRVRFGRPRKLSLDQEQWLDGLS
jgi:hypothetical protein